MHEPGGSDRLIYEEVDVPSPAIGDVLVRVHAASFTLTELTWPATSFDRSGRDRRPAIPGHEVSGTVLDLGFGTTGFIPGEGGVSGKAVLRVISTAERRRESRLWVSGRVFGSCSRRSMP
jgi:NADPH:quinone reductase-like Zn-dependent oxidoreductase